MASALGQQPASERAVVRVRAALFLICLLPLARLVLAGTTGWFGGLGANPVELITRSTGTWTLVLLCCTLAVTPLRRFTGWNRLIRLRRMLGLYTFFYGVLHLMTWVWFDQFFDLSDMGRDLAKRPFIAMGMVAFVSMVPLAATSTQSMIRRLGRRWAVLHRLIYLTAVAAILHYLWHKAGKNDFTQVSVYAAVIAVLLATRLIPRRRAGPTAPTPSRAA
jgi:sulfoxide reductase heme-binding subunit YedZ